MEYLELRERVCAANRRLVDTGLVVLSFGNVSGVDRPGGIFAIKPSGVDYAGLRPADIVLVSLDDGHVVDGELRPSSDTPTHRALYLAFPGLGGIVHTHSLHASSWAQARREIPCFGTSHADHFRGSVPVTRLLSDDEIAVDYEWHTGGVIIERFREAGIDADEVPACLDACHGPFTWGPTPEKAVDNAVALEHVAAMAIHTLALSPRTGPITEALLEKHHSRKHGAGAYYGQAGYGHAADADPATRPPAGDLPG